MLRWILFSRSRDGDRRSQQVDDTTGQCGAAFDCSRMDHMRLSRCLVFSPVSHKRIFIYLISAQEVARRRLLRARGRRARYMVLITACSAFMGHLSARSLALRPQTFPHYLPRRYNRVSKIRERLYDSYSHWSVGSTTRKP